MFSKKFLASAVFCLTMITCFSASAAPANFNGNWFGSCRSNMNQERNSSVNIYHGSHGVMIDNRNFRFGQVVETRIPTDPNEFPPTFNVAFEVVNLTNNGSTMEYLYSGILRQYPSQPWQIVVKTKYSIINGLLVTTMNDLTTGFAETCHFTKY